MKVGILGDLHLISPRDCEEPQRSKREAFVTAWPSLQNAIEQLNGQDVDHVILTGDLVDFYTDKNRDFALDLLEDLKAPWHLTPGNHDFQRLRYDDGEFEWVADRDTILEGWAAADIPLHNRHLDLDNVRFLLVESALSEVPQGTATWLDEQLRTDNYCILCTHVPLDVPPVVEAIHDREPSRSLEKYVQRGSPELYKQSLRHRVDAVVSGHLHFSTEAVIDETHQHILPLGIRRYNEQYPTEGTVTIIDTESPRELRQFRTEPLSG